jgi:hypothetical protein
MKIRLLILFGVLAVLLPWGNASMGAQFCVENADTLQAALTAAQSNGEDDVIQLVHGHYAVSTVPSEDPNTPGYQVQFPFSYESTERRSIAILGGFAPGCVSRDLNPSNTVLDGMSDSGWKTTQALRLQNTGGGDIILEGVTVQNAQGGFGGSPGVALSVDSSSTSPPDGPAGSIILRKNVFYKNGDRHASGVAAVTHAISGVAGEITVIGNLFKENRSMWNTGGLDAASQSENGEGGAIRLVNNLFVGNSCSPYGQLAGNAFKLSTSGEVVLTNNTVTGNDGTGEAAVYLEEARTLFMYNNIVWGNSAGKVKRPDILTHDVGASYGFNNNYSSMVKVQYSSIYGQGLVSSSVEGSWSFSDGNLNVAPLFEDPASDDFHLQRLSHMVDAGSTDAPDLPETDFEGNPRGNGDPNLISPYPDIGAFEYVRPIPPQQPTRLNLTSLEDMERAPVRVQLTGCETKIMETIVNVGPYRSPVDLYIAMGRPDGTFFLIDPQGRSTSEWVPFREAIVTGRDMVARSETIFDISQGWLVPQGIWTLYWLILPSTGTGIEGIDWATDPYELGWVYFQVPVLSAEWRSAPVYDRAGDPLEFWMVSAGSKNQVVAMSTSGSLYKYSRTFFAEGFEPMASDSPVVRHLSVGCDGTLWFITWDGVLGRAAPNSTSYDWPSGPVPGPELIQISVGRADQVWGVDAEGRIFRRQGEGWVQVEGELGWVSVGCDGTVWGVHPTGQIFRRDGDQWTKIPGELSQISVGDSGVVWGVHPTGQIFKWLGDRWIQVEGALRQISASSDGALWGVTPDLRLVKNTSLCERY